MEKNGSSLIPDVKRIYSDVEFLNYMSDQVSWSDNKAFVQLRDLRVFFWSQDRLIELKKKGNEPIKEKMKSALGFLDFHYIPTLVQFWAPNEVGCQKFLETSEFPFGISSLKRGLCWYRKKCLNYKYSADGESNEEEYGPVGRVFRNGFPEFSPNVSLYSAKEYKLRDFAVTCGVIGYLALPVFEYGGQHPVGVLELMSMWDGSCCLTDKIGKVDDALKVVGLRLSKIRSPFDMEWDQSSQHELALTEIKKILEVACCTHTLPFAQAWFYSKEKKCSGDFLCTSEKGSYVLAKSVESFQKECMHLCLKKGKSVVWIALESGKSCFCGDIKQLRISEYSLVNIARKFDLTSCFAICLQRKGSGSDVYVLEFFLPDKPIYREQAFLGLLLATVKKHSQSFKVASGLELGAELSVEVIKLPSDNEVDSFRIRPAPTSQEVSQNQVESFCSENAGRNFFGKERNRSEITMKEHENAAAGENSGSRSSRRPKDLHKRKADDDIKVLPNKRNTDHSPSRQENVQGPKNHNVEFRQTKQTQPAIRIESPIVIKAVHEKSIIKFQFPLTAGIKDFESEVEKRLELKAGSYEINHINDDNGKISLASDADLQKFMKTMVSLKKTTVRVLLEPVKIQHIERCSNAVVHPLPQTSELQNKTPMFIKVIHNDDTIKFQLPLSAGMMEFKDEVMKRIKLDRNSFGIKYRDEENEWIPIASDTHLQSYMSKMRSKEVRAVRFYIELITN